ncbi:MAG: GTP cyclohydrolase II [Alphaproteobacteria bacterium]|nr:GTP cyclohydrolase II [Alphaproteobacteria bacterium]
MSVIMKAAAQLPTRYGAFWILVFHDDAGAEHMAMVAGTPSDGCLVRLHSECATGDIMGSLRCDCRDQLEQSLTMIEEAGEGVVIYIRNHEGRGIGLANKIKAYMLQDEGVDTVDANLELGFTSDQREYSTALAILRHFDLKSVRLMTNNKDKVKALQETGIEVVAQVPLWTATNPHNRKYISTKRDRMGHVG